MVCKRVLMIAVVPWLGNLVFFLGSLWGKHYFHSINHWAQHPLSVMFWSSSAMKVVLTAILIGVVFNYAEYINKERERDDG